MKRSKKGKPKQTKVTGQQYWSLIFYEVNDDTLPAGKNIVLLAENEDGDGVVSLAIRTGISSPLNLAFHIVFQIIKKLDLKNCNILIGTNISAFDNCFDYASYHIFHHAKGNKKKLMSTLRKRDVTIDTHYIGFDPNIYQAGLNLLRSVGQQSLKYPDTKNNI